jgi:hypothetical protein
MPSLKNTVLLPSMAIAIAAIVACEPRNDDDGCTNNADCAVGRICVAGTCAECAGSGDCAADQFCCQGACLPESETERRCGCSPTLNGNPGADCTASAELQLCLVDGAVATRDDVDQGACGCACTPAQGGPLCAPPEEAGGTPRCTCEENVDCRGASSDALGRPHRSADTCTPPTPTSSCVCFSTGNATVCDPDGETPDCTSVGGCASLATDILNCGVPARSCSDAATGLDDGSGTCIEGGCECNADSDCVGEGLNVDSCDIVGDSARCICDDYTRAGEPAACPMELECVTGGCSLDGVVFATEEDLKAELDVP